MKFHQIFENFWNLQVQLNDIFYYVSVYSFRCMLEILK